MRFAKRVFLVAGIYGVIALIPQYFFPAPAQRPEFFYGFIGIALAWQILFFVIASDPVRFRPAMPVGILEKVAFGLPTVVLFAQNRTTVDMLAAAIVDLVWAVLFFVSWKRTS